MSLIRGSPQRAILGPMRLARRPASHPPDQRQDSAVTNVALCVVSTIVIEKHFLWQWPAHALHHTAVCRIRWIGLTQNSSCAENATVRGSPR
ncbi:hypothetical protein ALQ90_04924 [Pseudomonas savastanoi pv. savastanoi]|nr:hypothetical protein ALQ90_04924 [Pseudomonas savastanoi pv. savastanoi]